MIILSIAAGFKSRDNPFSSALAGAFNDLNESIQKVEAAAAARAKEKADKNINIKI